MQQSARTRKMDAKPYLTRRNWWLEERDRAVRSSVKTGFVSLQFSDNTGSAGGWDQSGTEGGSGPVRLGPVPSIGVVGIGGCVGDSARVNSNRGGGGCANRRSSGERERVG
ncbi:unnamed protein product [Prunus armeniaca]